ncbi:Receptor-interacting serine/threonine-protein kinase 1, partial [Nowakowskiella sp. JEL0078]
MDLWDSSENQSQASDLSLKANILAIYCKDCFRHWRPLRCLRLVKRLSETIGAFVALKFAFLYLFSFRIISYRSAISFECANFLISYSSRPLLQLLLLDTTLLLQLNELSLSLLSISSGKKIDWDIEDAEDDSLDANLMLTYFQSFFKTDGVLETSEIWDRFAGALGIPKTNISDILNGLNRLIFILYDTPGLSFHTSCVEEDLRLILLQFVTIAMKKGSSMLQDTKISVKESFQENVLRELSLFTSSMEFDLWEPSIHLPKRQLLGVGSLGPVLRSFHMGVTPVAVKLCVLSSHMSSNFRKVFISDTLDWMKLRHDNLQPVFGVLPPHESSKFALISVPLALGSVYDYLALKSRNIPEITMNILSQTSLALSYLHRMGVTHGRLNADNVLVDFSGNVRVSDFGMDNFREMMEEYENTEILKGCTFDGDETSLDIRKWTFSEIVDSYVDQMNQLKSKMDEEVIYEKKWKQFRWCAPEILRPLVENMEINENEPIIETLTDFSLRPGPKTFASDVYSFGILAWAVCRFSKENSNVEPFSDLLDPRSVAISVCLQNLRPSPRPSAEKCSSELWELITQCWDNDISNRPSMESVAASLCKWKPRNTFLHCEDVYDSCANPDDNYQLSRIAKDLSLSENNWDKEMLIQDNKIENKPSLNVKITTRQSDNQQTLYLDMATLKSPILNSHLDLKQLPQSPPASRNTSEDATLLVSETSDDDSNRNNFMTEDSNRFTYNQQGESESGFRRLRKKGSSILGRVFMAPKAPTVDSRSEISSAPSDRITLFPSLKRLVGWKKKDTSDAQTKNEFQTSSIEKLNAKKHLLFEDKSTSALLENEFEASKSANFDRYKLDDDGLASPESSTSILQQVLAAGDNVIKQKRDGFDNSTSRLARSTKYISPSITDLTEFAGLMNSFHFADVLDAERELIKRTYHRKSKSSSQAPVGVTLPKKSLMTIPPKPDGIVLPGSPQNEFLGSTEAYEKKSNRTKM